MQRPQVRYNSLAMRTQKEERESLKRAVMRGSAPVATNMLGLYELETKMLRAGAKLKRTVTRAEAEEINQSTGWNIKLVHE